MAILRYHGTASREQVPTLGTARTPQPPFPPGTDPIWRCLRYVSPLLTLNQHFLTSKSVRSDLLAFVTSPDWLIRFQQVLWTHAQDIASKYPDDQRDRYMDAALNLRHPYWDWALHSELPDVVTQSRITVYTPTGKKEFDNPLYQYAFQSDAAGNGFPLTHPVYRNLPQPHVGCANLGL